MLDEAVGYRLPMDQMAVTKSGHYMVDLEQVLITLYEATLRELEKKGVS